MTINVHNSYHSPFSSSVFIFPISFVLKDTLQILRELLLGIILVHFYKSFSCGLYRYRFFSSAFLNLFTIPTPVVLMNVLFLAPINIYSFFLPFCHRFIFFPLSANFIPFRVLSIDTGNNYNKYQKEITIN